MLAAWANAFAKGVVAGGARQERLSTTHPPNVNSYTTSPLEATNCYFDFTITKSFVKHHFSIGVLFQISTAAPRSRATGRIFNSYPPNVNSYTTPQLAHFPACATLANQDSLFLYEITRLEGLARGG